MFTNRKVHENVIQKNGLICLLFSMIVCQEILTGFFEHALGFAANANLMVLVLWTTILIVAISCNERVSINISSVILVLIIFISYVMAKYVLGGCQFYPMMIIFYAVIPVFVSIQRIDIERVLRYCMYLSILTLPYLSDLFRYQYVGLRQASMGNSYSIAAILIPACIHFWYYRINTKLVEKLLYCYDAFLGFRLIITGNRGAILTVFVCICVLWLNSVKQGGYTSGNSPQKLFLIFLAFAMATYLILNIENVVFWMSGVLSAAGVNVPSFLLKSITLMEETNRGIGNGRNELYDIALKYITQNPIFGYGIGTFGYYTGYPWAHNYLLQAAFEGGIIFFIPVFVVSLYYLVYMLKQSKKEKAELSFVALLFCECIPRYLISNDPWRGTTIWLFIGYGFSVLFKMLHLSNKRKYFIISTRK